MKDPRFLPVEKRDPVDDYAEEADSDSLFIGGEADAEEQELETSHPSGKKGNTLYIAS